jgi:hypothetical protein
VLIVFVGTRYSFKSRHALWVTLLASLVTMHSERSPNNALPKGAIRFKGPRTSGSLLVRKLQEREQSLIG